MQENSCKDIKNDVNMPHFPDILKTNLQILIRLTNTLILDNAADSLNLAVLVSSQVVNTSNFTLPVISFEYLIKITLTAIALESESARALQCLKFLEIVAILAPDINDSRVSTEFIRSCVDGLILVIAPRVSKATYFNSRSISHVFRRFLGVGYQGSVEQSKSSVIRKQFFSFLGSLGEHQARMPSLSLEQFECLAELCRDIGRHDETTMYSQRNPTLWVQSFLVNHISNISDDAIRDRAVLQFINVLQYYLRSSQCRLDLDGMVSGITHILRTSSFNFAALDFIKSQLLSPYFNSTLEVSSMEAQNSLLQIYVKLATSTPQLSSFTISMFHKSPSIAYLASVVGRFCLTLEVPVGATKDDAIVRDHLIRYLITADMLPMNTRRRPTARNTNSLYVSIHNLGGSDGHSSLDNIGNNSDGKLNQLESSKHVFVIVKLLVLKICIAKSYAIICQYKPEIWTEFVSFIRSCFRNASLLKCHPDVLWSLLEFSMRFDSLKLLLRTFAAEQLKQLKLHAIHLMARKVVVSQLRQEFSNVNELTDADRRRKRGTKSVDISGAVLALFRKRAGKSEVPPSLPTKQGSRTFIASMNRPRGSSNQAHFKDGDVVRKRLISDQHKRDEKNVAFSEAAAIARSKLSHARSTSSPLNINVEVRGSDGQLFVDKSKIRETANVEESLPRPTTSNTLSRARDAMRPRFKSEQSPRQSIMESNHIRSPALIEEIVVEQGSLNTSVFTMTVDEPDKDFNKPHQILAEGGTTAFVESPSTARLRDNLYLAPSPIVSASKLPRMSTTQSFFTKEVSAIISPEMLELIKRVIHLLSTKSAGDVELDVAHTVETLKVKLQKIRAANPDMFPAPII